MFKIKGPNNNSHPQRYYTNILITLTIIITATIFILSSVLYFTFENIALTIINSFIKDGLSQTSYSTTYMCNLAKSLCLQIYFDNNVSKLSYYAPPDVRERFLATEQLRSYRNTSPSIQSVYVYASKRNTLYTSLANLEEIDPEKIGAFYDKDIFNILKEIREYKRLVPIPRKISNAYPKYIAGSYSGVYTFLFYDSPESSAVLDDRIVILNISEDYLRKTIRSLDTEPESNTFIIDNKGSIIVSDNKNFFLTDISRKNYVKQILSSNSKSGYFISNIDNVKSLVTYVSSDTLDWKYIRIIPYNTIMGKINSMKSKTFIIGFIILVCGFSLSLLLSRKLYKPIRNALLNLSSLQEDNINAQKQIFLKGLLLNDIEDTNEDIQNDYIKYQIKVNQNLHFFIILLKIDHFKEFCMNNSISCRAQIKIDIMNAAGEICVSKFSCEPIDMGDDNIAILCNIGEDVSSSHTTAVNDLIKNIQQSIYQYYNISLSAAVSTIIDSINGINLIYYEALNTSNYRLVYGHHSIIYTNDVKENAEAKFIYPAENSRLLIDSLMLGKTTEAQELYNQITNYCINYSYNIIKSTLLRLAVDINIVIDTVQRNSVYPIPYNLNTFISKLDSLETLDEINKHFFSLFENIVPKLEDKTLSKYDIILNKAIDAITKQYKDPNLSIDVIADLVNMSSMYFGRLFKKMKSKSVADYINEVRVEKARELLLETDSSINEIAEQTGFITHGYFYKLFKKTYAITPNQYRQNNKLSSS